MFKLLPPYYRNEDVISLAKDLLGKVLYTQIDGKISAGMIVETEAYFGIKDKASHAYGGKRTSRTETMYANGGIAYVYLCYGIHHLFNIVTSKKDDPCAVLIRAIEPLVGVNLIEERRNMLQNKPAITSGPGSVAKALGIDKSFNAKDLCEDEIWVEDHQFFYNQDQIVSSARVGVAYAQEHALLPLRFFVKGNKYVSKPSTVQINLDLS